MQSVVMKHEMSKFQVSETHISFQYPEWRRARRVGRKCEGRGLSWRWEDEKGQKEKSDEILTTCLTK